MTGAVAGYGGLGGWRQWSMGMRASAVLHGGLILWIVFYDLFQAPDAPIIPDVTEVAIISAADFEALQQPQPVAPPPAPPPAADPDPEPAPQPAAQPVEQPVQTPAPIEAPAPIQAPAPVEPPAPVAPPAPVGPDNDRPQAQVVAQNTTPDSSLTPVQRPAERVAPQAAPVPDPTVATAPRDQAAITPDATAPSDAPEAREATAREAAATETVTEATQIDETAPARRTATAPEVSLRPRSRPARPAPQPDPQPATQPAPQPTPAPAQPQPPAASAIEDALAQALGQTLGEAIDTPATQLSAADSDLLRLGIEACWNVGLLSTDAMNVRVTISFEMTPDARPIADSIRQVEAAGGSFASQQVVFETGRQAIMQCGSNGFPLPLDLYDQWRLVEITFNPAQMSSR